MRTPKTIAPLGLLVLLVACSQGTSSSSPGSLANGSGGGDNGDGIVITDPEAPTLEVRLVDAPSDEAKEVVVTIAKVQALGPDGKWVNLSTTSKTLDLLKLQNGVSESLGVGKLPEGVINNLRLYVDPAGDNHVTTLDDVRHELKVPSGAESGIKVKAGFRATRCSQGAITIDFDAKKSCAKDESVKTTDGPASDTDANSRKPQDAGKGSDGVDSGNGGAGRGGGTNSGAALDAGGAKAHPWILRPVIRLHSVVAKGQCGDGGSGSKDERESSPDGGRGDGAGGDAKDTPRDGGSSTAGGAESGRGSEPSRSGGDDVCATAACAEGSFCMNGACVPVTAAD